MSAALDPLKECLLRHDVGAQFSNSQQKHYYFHKKRQGLQVWLDDPDTRPWGWGFTPTGEYQNIVTMERVGVAKNVRPPLPAGWNVYVSKSTRRQYVHNPAHPRIKQNGKHRRHHSGDVAIAPKVQAPIF